MINVCDDSEERRAKQEPLHINRPASKQASKQRGANAVSVSTAAATVFVVQGGTILRSLNSHTGKRPSIN